LTASGRWSFHCCRRHYSPASILRFAIIFDADYFITPIFAAAERCCRDFTPFLSMLRYAIHAATPTLRRLQPLIYFRHDTPLITLSPPRRFAITFGC
jgi:hypothetical protein